VNSNNQEDQEYQERKEFLDERRFLIENEIREAASFDKYLLTISTGALAISITFMGQIRSTLNPMWLFMAFWISILITISAVVLSFKFSSNAWKRQRDILEEEYITGENNSEANNAWTRAMKILNWVGLCSFILGIISLLVLSILNVHELE
jgi:hypothetical protein